MAAVGVLGDGYFGRRADNFKSEQRKAEQVAFDQKLDSLVVGNRDLQGQLQPFLELARKRFPELAPDQALENFGNPSSSFNSNRLPRATPSSA